jgi:hypothetical protein
VPERTSDGEAGGVGVGVVDDDDEEEVEDEEGTKTEEVDGAEEE